MNGARTEASRSPFRAAEDGVRVSVRATPRASSDAIEGVAVRPGIGAQLRVRVTAPPDKGRANAALLRLLADAWDVPVSSLAVVTGDTGRDKGVLVQGEAAALLGHLERWLEANP